MISNRYIMLKISLTVSGLWCTIFQMLKMVLWERALIINISGLAWMILGLLQMQYIIHGLTALH